MKYTIEEIKDIVESEGLGYAIMEYVEAKKIEDPNLAELWRDAYDSLKGIEAILEE